MNTLLLVALGTTVATCLPSLDPSDAMTATPEDEAIPEEELFGLFKHNKHTAELATNEPSSPKPSSPGESAINAIETHATSDVFVPRTQLLDASLVTKIPLSPCADSPESNSGCPQRGKTAGGFDAAPGAAGNGDHSGQCNYWAFRIKCPVTCNACGNTNDPKTWDFCYDIYTQLGSSANNQQCTNRDFQTHGYGKWPGGSPCQLQYAVINTKYSSNGASGCVKTCTGCGASSDPLAKSDPVLWYKTKVERKKAKEAAKEEVRVKEVKRKEEKKKAEKAAKDKKIKEEKAAKEKKIKEEKAAKEKKIKDEKDRKATWKKSTGLTKYTGKTAKACKKLAEDDLKEIESAVKTENELVKTLQKTFETCTKTHDEAVAVVKEPVTKAKASLAEMGNRKYEVKFPPIFLKDLKFKDATDLGNQLLEHSSLKPVIARYHADKAKKEFAKKFVHSSIKSFDTSQKTLHKTRNECQCTTLKALSAITKARKNGLRNLNWKEAVKMICGDKTECFRQHKFPLLAKIKEQSTKPHCSPAQSLSSTSA